MTVANVRLQMNTMPAMGRSHFFAFFTVITSLCLGLTPIIWGICLDAMSGLNHVSGPFMWNRYSVYFLALMAATVVTLLVTPALRESAKLDEQAPVATTPSEV